MQKIKPNCLFYRPLLCWWQKGSIENANKLVRQYFPKKTNFDNIDYQQINNIQKIINARPRKILMFKNPKENFFYNFES